MNQYFYITLIIVPFLIISLVGYKIYKSKQNKKFPQIKGAIVGIDVDYKSNIQIKTSSDVQNAFNKFIEYSKNNKKEIYPGPFKIKSVKNWKFENSEIHGKYGGKKYWKVNASFLHGKEKISQNIYDLDQDGKVVRLLYGV